MQLASTLPNYMLDQNAVLRDEGVSWRHGSVPDYSMANAAFETGEPQPACLIKRQSLATYAFAVVASVSLGFRNLHERALVFVRTIRLQRIMSGVVLSRSLYP